MNLKTILISSGSSGMRLGNYLRFLFPDMRESDLRRLFSGRDVKLDETLAELEEQGQGRYGIENSMDGK